MSKKMSIKYWHLITPMVFAIMTSALWGGGAAEEKEGKTITATVEYTTPASTVADLKGYTGEFPYQFELSEYEQKIGCEMTFQENHEIAKLNAEIVGNPDLPPVEERLPAEPLVLQPWSEIGKYGGQLNGVSQATEAGTSDLMSVRHVNLVRFHDDYQTLKPDIAKSWEWNDDFTVLIITLRKGHKWSDRQPFTAEDIAFWYNDLLLNKEIYPKPPGYAFIDNKPWKVEVLNETTVKFTFPIPYPNFLVWNATTYVQPFQPKHFLEQYHIKYNPNADALAKEKGFDGWAALLKQFYGSSDWKDVPSPLLKGSFDYVSPTLESHILTVDTPSGRHLVANPYFHQVDTVGNQLPYISRIDEIYVIDFEVQNLKVTRGVITYKTQSIPFQEYPLFKENEKTGNYSAHLTVAPNLNQWYSFNTTVKDPQLRKIFNDLRFRQAMSLAIDREEINEIVTFGQGKPQQWTPGAPGTVAYVTEEDLNYLIEYNPDRSNALLDEMGLKERDRNDFRKCLDGSKLTIYLRYSHQENSPRMMELVRDYWAAVGVRVEIREVTSDEYRMRANNNDSDMTTWGGSNINGYQIATMADIIYPPFGSYFNPGTGFAWAAWHQSNGTEGIEPPDDVKQLYKLSDEFRSQLLGSEESNRIGREIVGIHLRNLWRIGTVGAIPGVVIQHNSLGNFQPFTVYTVSYWSYAFRPTQWFLKK